MTDSNSVLNQAVLATLAARFTLIVISVDEFGRETEKSIKIKKKEFLKQTANMGLNARQVEKFPDIMEFNCLYIKKGGKTVWFKEREGS